VIETTLTTEQEYFLIGLGSGAVIGIGLLTIAIYCKFRPALQLIGALSDIKDAILN